jgi:hypothetical protein
MPRPLEWVAPRPSEQWSLNWSGWKSRPDSKESSKTKDEKKPEQKSDKPIRTAKGRGKPKSGGSSPLAIEGRPPRGRSASDAPPNTYPMGTERRALEGRGPLGNPGSDAPPRTFTPVSPRQLPYTVKDREAGQAEMGRMVRDIMAQRQITRAGTGETGEIISPGAGWSAPSRRDMTIQTGELVSHGPSKTGEIRAIGAPLHDAATGPIQLNTTRPIPAVELPSRTFTMGQTPNRPRRTGITSSAEPFGQMSMFNVSPNRGEENLMKAREDQTVRLSTVPQSSLPSRQVSKLAARTSLPKAPGSQGTLFQPARYKTAP